MKSAYCCNQHPSGSVILSDFNDDLHRSGSCPQNVSHTLWKPPLLTQVLYSITSTATARTPTSLLVSWMSTILIWCYCCFSTCVISLLSDQSLHSLERCVASTIHLQVNNSSLVHVDLFPFQYQLNSLQRVTITWYPITYSALCKMHSSAWQ